MNKVFSICILAAGITMFSCGGGKSEKDFIGKYKTFYSTKIEVANSFTMAIGRKPVITAKVFQDLGEVSLEFFEDQKKSIVGEASIVIKAAENRSFNPRETETKVDFDLTNLRVKGDTLEFNFENEVLKMQGKKVKGALVLGQGGAAVIGLSGDMGLNEGDSNPFLAKKEQGFLYYSVFDEKKIVELKTKFFRDQESEIMNSVKSESNQTKKAIAENSLKEVQARLK